MSIRMNPSGLVAILGYVILIGGVSSSIPYVAARVFYSQPPDMGILLGNCAIVLTGLVATSVATCLRKIERRMDSMESARRASGEGASHRDRART
jgi:hypothetical protein